MPRARINAVGNIEFAQGWGRPDQGLPGEGGAPDNTLPGGGEYPDQGLPGGGFPGTGRPSHPIALPPMPPDLKPEHPIVLPSPGAPEQPIYIPVEPEHPIALPPGEIWPPLPPSSGINGKTVVLIYVVGVGYRWFYYSAPVIYPPVAGPK